MENIKRKTFNNMGIGSILVDLKDLFSKQGITIKAISEGNETKTPFIKFEVPGKPEFKYLNQSVLLEEVMEKYGVSKQDIYGYENLEAVSYYDFLIATRCNEKNKSGLYQMWEIANITHGKKVLKLLSDYWQVLPHIHTYHSLHPTVNSSGTVTISPIFNQLNLLNKKEAIPEYNVEGIVVQFNMLLTYIKAVSLQSTVA